MFLWHSFQPNKVHVTVADAPSLWPRGDNCSNGAWHGKRQTSDGITHATLSLLNTQQGKSWYRLRYVPVQNAASSSISKHTNHYARCVKKQHALVRRPVNDNIIPSNFLLHCLCVWTTPHLYETFVAKIWTNRLIEVQQRYNRGTAEL